MIPSLVNSCDIFMVTASAVILNTIGLFYHVNYIRKALCCQVACPCPLNLLCPMLMPGWSWWLHLVRGSITSAQLVPTIWAPVNSTRKLSNLSPPPPPPRPHIAAHNPARNLIWYSVFNQNRSVTLSTLTFNCFLIKNISKVLLKCVNKTKRSIYEFQWILKS